MARLSLFSHNKGEVVKVESAVGNGATETDTDVTVTKLIIDESSFDVVVSTICVVFILLLLLLLDNVVSCCCCCWWGVGDTDNVGSDGVSLAAVVVGECERALQSPVDASADDDSSSSVPESDPSVSMLAFRNLRVDDVVVFSAGAELLEPPRQGRQQRNSVELKSCSFVSDYLFRQS